MKREEKRNRGRVLTLNHNENSNKNININISYNLGQVSSPFNRRLQTQNYNPNNSLNSTDQRSTTGIKGKKIDNKEIEYAFQQDRLLHNSLSKDSHTHPKLTEEADEECEISIKVIKKKKAPLSNELIKSSLQGKLTKHKTNQSFKAKRRLHTEQAVVGPSTTTNKSQQNKNFFSTQEHALTKPTDFNQLTKLYKQNRRKSRSCSKEHSESRKKFKSGDRKKTIQEQKEQFEELVKKLKKNNASKESLPRKDPIGSKIKKRNKSEIIPQPRRDKQKEKEKEKKVRQKSSQKLKPKKQLTQEKQRLTFPRKSIQKQNPRQKAMSDYRAHYDIEPYIMSRLMNSSMLSDSIKMSELTSKQLSQRKYLDIVEQSLTQNKNSLELASGIREMREFQLNKAHILSRIPEESSMYSNPSFEQIQLMNKAATDIKQHWKQYRRKKIIQYYSSIFNKNKSVLQEDVSEILGQEARFPEEDAISYADSFQNNEEDIGSPFKESDLEENAQRIVKELLDSSIDKKLQQKKAKNDHSESDKAQQDEQFQFATNKYQGYVQRSLQSASNTQKSSSIQLPLTQQLALVAHPLDISPKPEQDIHRFKQQQLQQWNHINKLINWQLNHQQQMDPHILLQELMKQSELNKRWIEESCEVSLKNEQSQPNSRPGSAASQRSDNYKNLIEERGIADRLRKNSQNIKAMLCNTYEIEKEEKSVTGSKHSNSVEVLKRQEVEEKSDKIEKGGNSAKIDELMTYELMNDDDSEDDGIPFKKRRREKNQLIDKFLDCGLHECGFEEISQRKSEPEQVNIEYKEPQKQLSPEQQLRRRSRNVFVNGERRDPILSPKPNIDFMPSQPTLFEDSPEDMQPMVKMEDHPRNILINEDSQTQSIEEEDYGDNEPVSRLFQQEKTSRHAVFESICNSILQQFCMQVQTKQKFERAFVNCFSNNKVVKNRQRGIKTNYASIKAYLVNLVDYIMSHEDEKAQVLRNINATLGPTSTQMLYYLRIQQYSDYESSEEDEDTVLIISYETFQRFEMYLDRQQSEDSSYRKNSKLQGYTFGWHRALLECMNEALDEQRPYGTHGKPYDWQVQPRLKNVVITQQTLQKHLEQSASKVLQIVSFLGGILFEKQDSPFYGTLLLQEHKMQINEDRLSRILATELFQTQDMWIVYNDEKLQLMIELSNLIYERFMFEAAAEFNKIRRRRALLNEPKY